MSVCAAKRTDPRGFEKEQACGRTRGCEGAPILTIVVPAYNTSDYIGTALSSLIGVSGLEVLIVNDGSTDDTAEIASKYVKEAPDEFRLITKANGGYGSVVNVGLAEKCL